MANIGRVVKRLFERDMGYRPLNTFIYLPNRYRMAAFPGLPSNCIRFTNSVEPSDVGIVDYSLGTVTYRFAPAAAITPGAFARLVFTLTGDENFISYETFWGIGATDIYKTWSTLPLTSFPFVSNFPNFAWLVTPTPMCTPGRVGFSEWRWTNGPPQ